MRLFKSFLIFTLLSFFFTASAFGELNVYKNLGGDFTLTGHNGKISLTDFRGKVVLMTFGYATCPDVCPLILVNLKQLLKKMDSNGDDVKTIFVSFDPERDTPKKLHAYVNYFHSSFTGLTGSQDEIAQMASKYKFAYLKQEGESAGGYFFAHSDYVYLIDQQGRVRALYGHNAPADKMAKDIRHLLAAN